MVIQIDGVTLKKIDIPPGIKNEKLWLFTTLYNDVDTRARTSKSLKKVVHIPGVLINFITK